MPTSPATSSKDAAPQPVQAVSVAILHEGKFLLVRRGRPPAKDLYAFPGGRMEAGESREETVRREAMEETGATLADISHVVDLEIPAEDSDRIEFILAVHAARYAGGEIVAGDDAAEAVWVSVDEMAKMKLAGSVLDIARKLASQGAAQS